MSGTYRSIKLPVRRSPATRWYRQNRLSTIDFDRQQPIEGEIDRRRSIEGEINRRRSIEGKEERIKKRRRRRKKYLLSPYRPRPCTVTALARRRFFSARGPREETE
ncbi:hypothetical protein B296_00035058, partial [Ensete ventricosum]